MTTAPRSRFVPVAAAVVGSTTIDEVVGPLRRPARRIGGTTTYAGLTYRRLGVKTHIVSNIGAAQACIAERLKSHGLRLHLGESPGTTRFVNRFDGDRRFQQMPSAATPVQAEPLNAILPHLDWVHLGPLHPTDIEADLLAHLARWSNPVLLDVQGYTRQVAPDSDRVLPGTCGLLADALETASLVKAGQDEFEIISDSMKAGPRQLMTRFRIDELIITRGSRGGVVWSSAGAAVDFSAADAGRGVDPTGAGDVFMAAYAVSRLVHRRTIESAARDAAALAARQVAGRFIEIIC